MTRKQAFFKGMKAGIPIALGYFAVAFSLGIAARNVGLTAFQGFLASLLNSASAGEYAMFSLIGAGASVVELILVTLVANGRYLLMSCALGQKFSEDTPLIHRFGVGAYITDEIFSLSISLPGHQAELLVQGVEHDDEDADDKRVDRQGEDQAEKFVQPAEHRQFRHFRKQFRHEEHDKGDGDKDECERDDVQRGFGHVQIRLQPGADQGREPESGPHAQDDTGEGEGLLQETL